MFLVFPSGMKSFLLSISVKQQLKLVYVYLDSLRYYFIEI